MTEFPHMDKLVVATDEDPVLLEALIKDLVRDEGSKLKPYHCSENKLTIGIGRNLDDVGINKEESYYLLTTDLVGISRDLDRNILWWRDMPDSARRGLLNMAFNLGWPKLQTFRRMLAALKASDYERAALETLNSKYAKQVGSRACRIADLFREAARWEADQ